MAKQVKKEQIFKFEKGSQKDLYQIKSTKGDVSQGHIFRGFFSPLDGRDFSLDDLNEIAEFIKGLDKGE